MKKNYLNSKFHYNTLDYNFSQKILNNTMNYNVYNNFNVYQFPSGDIPLIRHSMREDCLLTYIVPDNGINSNIM